MLSAWKRLFDVIPYKCTRKVTSVSSFLKVYFRCFFLFTYNFSFVLPYCGGFLQAYRPPLSHSVLMLSPNAMGRALKHARSPVLWGKNKKIERTKPSSFHYPQNLIWRWASAMVCFEIGLEINKTIWLLQTGNCQPHQTCDRDQSSRWAFIDADEL